MRILVGCARALKSSALKLCNEPGISLNILNYCRCSLVRLLQYRKIQMYGQPRQ
jgi:hypothetical protein